MHRAIISYRKGVLDFLSEEPEAFKIRSDFHLAASRGDSLVAPSGYAIFKKNRQEDTIKMKDIISQN